MKLIGKMRAAWRRNRARNSNITRSVGKGGSYTARDYVAHYHASGEDRFLCGIWYYPEQQRTGNHRAATTSQEVMCNGCQRIHTRLLRTAEGRERLGLTGRRR